MILYAQGSKNHYIGIWNCQFCDTWWHRMSKKNHQQGASQILRNTFPRCNPKATRDIHYCVTSRFCVPFFFSFSYHVELWVTILQGWPKLWFDVTEWRRQGRLWHERGASLAEGLHGKGRRSVHLGRRHPDEPPGPRSQLCEYALHIGLSMTDHTTSFRIAGMTVAPLV